MIYQYSHLKNRRPQLSFKYLFILFVIFLSVPAATSVFATNNSTQLLPSAPNEISCVTFQQQAPGTSVEGLGTVHPNLNISGSGNIVAIAEGQEPTLYSGPNYPGNIINIGTAEFGGFADEDQIHDYAFSFKPGMTVDYFSINMLDFGDFNPRRATEHSVSLVGYDKNGYEVARDTLSFTSDGYLTPDDELWDTGDATTAVGNPGNYIFTLTGASMSRVSFEYSTNLDESPSDTRFGLSILCFEGEETPPEPPTGTVCADFNLLEPGTSAEGLGAVHPNLNISGAGNIVAIAEGQLPALYAGPNIPGNLINYGSGLYGGISDASRVHDYTFTFAPDETVNYFSINMLDFGDYNPNGATEHNVSLVAYDSNGQVVSTDTLSFTSDGVLVRNEGLWITGDASASVGQPGNYYFVVEGAGIVRAELQFSSDLGTGPSDPNFGFSVLCFQPEPDTPPPPPTGTPLTCEDIGQQTLAVDTWNESVSSSLAPVSLSFTPPAGADYALVNTGWEWTGDVNQAQVTQMHTVETPFGSTTSGDYGNGELAGQVFWYDVLQGAYDQPSMPITISYAGNGSDSGSNQSHGLISWCGTPPPPPQLDPPTADLTLLLVKPAPIIGGKYLVEYACSATAPNLVSATINGYDMINGQQIRLIVSDTPSVRYWYNEVLAIYAPEFSFDVTCADDLGNEVSTQVIPEFIIP